jgi:hypothetical protein
MFADAAVSLQVRFTNDVHRIGNDIEAEYPVGIEEVPTKSHEFAALSLNNLIDLSHLLKQCPREVVYPMPRILARKMQVREKAEFHIILPFPTLYAVGRKFRKKVRKISGFTWCGENGRLVIMLSDDIALPHSRGSPELPNDAGIAAATVW